MKTPLDSLSTLAAFLPRHSALIALAVFAIAGVLVLDDYGVGFDVGWQREVGESSLDYILIGDENALIDNYIRYYGVAFEVPLTAVKRLLRLEDPRRIYLSRHLLTHLLFLAAGFFCWLLAHRLFGSRLVAFLAMLIFLLHPRIYAHSFFNSKDVPFLSAFMISLYLIHRAFRRDTVWAFALCGAGVGLLANIRIIGVMLVPAVLGMLALDAFHAARREKGEVKNALINACAFSITCAATIYAAWPLMWRDPFEALNALRVLSEHPTHYLSLFRGEFVKHPKLPWDFIPTWMLITTPPAVLALAALGIGRGARLCAVRWRDALANSAARFGLLALACLILPVAAAVALEPNMYSDWRHMYFLYAPLCVLAAFGLRGLAALPKRGVRAGAFALASFGILAASVQTVSLHPLQSDYFNFLVDKSELADRWEMDYWNVSRKEALDALLEMRPTGRIAIAPFRFDLVWDMDLIPNDDRRRLSIDPDFPSFRIVDGDGGENAVWKREVYGVPIVSILDARAESKAAFQAAYAAAKSSGRRAADIGGFDIYRNGGTLTYIKEASGEEGAVGWLDLNAIPLRPEEAGAEREPLNRGLRRHAAAFDGKSLLSVTLPNYPVRAVETAMRRPDGEESALWSVEEWLLFPNAQRSDGEEGALWSVTVDFYAAALSEPPSDLSASAGGFDIWLNGGEITYVKRQCAEGDTRGRFFLSVFPADPSDLPQTARDAGREHQALNFDFDRYGATVDGGCVIIRRLPDYPISRVETGQWIPGEGELWKARIEGE